MARRLFTSRIGKRGTPNSGCIHVKLAAYQAGAREAVLEAGGRCMGGLIFVLPKGTPDAFLDEIDRLTRADRARAMRERLPVAAADAAGLEIGSAFDFGGEVGVRPIVGISAPFTPTEATAADPRLGAFTGRSTVYLYNANPPAAAVPKRTERKKAEQRAASIAKRDASRFPVPEGSVTPGDRIPFNGDLITVVKLGKPFALKTEDEVAAMMARFPDAAGLSPGVTIQYAMLDHLELPISY
ncbi:hypothetical protein NHN26_15915 [Rhodovulum tesquicola]|uniref:hypothetical protein n=1 Tax=Rhodovulum tesquicola TaxID=540254 RepID=UPI00209841A4|nr:hypothetical protein [Rhodovulum tesquicola]MCO8146699.1 hypothetical protein [Rhodovulum tesquicola]